ncbi:copper chaperone for superoxide dismutase-like [Rhopilema esculentum]|uniref:copper chaperone for superoxide dismutase-like n=1 Tax=Rhopilema esculentum TaxID=499914 RepID=UPI0031DB6CCC
MATSLEEMIPTTMEFAVDMADNSSIDKIKDLIKAQKDIRLLDINSEKRCVVLETTLPSGVVQNLLEQSGDTVVFRGHGYSQGQGHIGAAVVHVMGDQINGIVRLVQTTEYSCVIDGTIDGLPKGKHGLHINTLGDLSKGCQSTGNHFNPTNTHHGNRTDSVRHVGDLGNIESDHNGRSVFRFQDEKVKVWDIIGRSLVVDAEEDRFHEDTNSSNGIACGIIARSAGLFENVKRVCQCSGKTLWEERQEAKQGLTSQL